MQFRRPRLNAGSKMDATAAVKALAAMEKSLPSDWRKAASEAARFEAFRSLPQAERLKLLAYCVALDAAAEAGSRRRRRSHGLRRGP